MTTLSDVIGLCRNDYLLAGTRETRNRLEGAHDASQTTFTFEFDTSAIQPGSKLSVGLEDCYVWSADPSAKTAFVQRADFGSTASTHADASIVTVNSRFSDAHILRAVNDELHSLSSPENGLFQIRTVEFTYDPAYQGFDLATTDLISIWQVRYLSTDGTKDHVFVEPKLWELRRSMNTTDFASGQALFLRGFVDSGATVRVTYKARYTTLSALTDDVTTSGLHSEASDLLAIGAAMRVYAGHEPQRNLLDAQGDTRRATEVPAGAAAGAWRNLAGLRAQRISEERTRLSRYYPERI